MYSEHLKAGLKVENTNVNRLICGWLYLKHKLYDIVKGASKCYYFLKFEIQLALYLLQLFDV